jgi:hypothetical protein
MSLNRSHQKARLSIHGYVDTPIRRRVYLDFRDKLTAYQNRHLDTEQLDLLEFFPLISTDENEILAPRHIARYSKSELFIHFEKLLQLLPSSQQHALFITAHNTFISLISLFAEIDEANKFLTLTSENNRRNYQWRRFGARGFDTLNNAHMTQISNLEKTILATIKFIKQPCVQDMSDKLAEDASVLIASVRRDPIQEYVRKKFLPTSITGGLLTALSLASSLGIDVFFSKNIHVPVPNTPANILVAAALGAGAMSALVGGFIIAQLFRNLLHNNNANNALLSLALLAGALTFNVTLMHDQDQINDPDFPVIVKDFYLTFINLLLLTYSFSISLWTSTTILNPCIESNIEEITGEIALELENDLLQLKDAYRKNAALEEISDEKSALHDATNENTALVTQRGSSLSNCCATTFAYRRAINSSVTTISNDERTVSFNVS